MPNFMLKELFEKTILKVAELVDIDLLMLAYESMGILKYQNTTVSGEKYVIEKILKKHIVTDRPVFFDVGANTGDYSRHLEREFPHAEIYAFEPNRKTFENLRNNLSTGEVRCVNLALGSTKMMTTMYNYGDDKKSGRHASLYKEVLVEFHQAPEIGEIECEMTTIDDFCRSNRIQHIDFLKIDAEGHELDVLRGAQDFLTSDEIDIIQFEFNEMGVISRIFLKDFYDILQNYRIYRIDTDRLIPLLSYASRNEIFQFQNFLAINHRIPCSDKYAELRNGRR
jgi:FkbM family methyltransferase